MVESSQWAPQLYVSDGARYTGGVPHVLLIDNFDSFTHNIRAGLESAGAKVTVFRADQATLADLEAQAPDMLVIGPGPGRPEEAHLALAALHHFSSRLPVLGICLGHQCLALAFGGRVVEGKAPVHGKVSALRHDGRGIFQGLPNPLQVGRYHSLLVTEVPDCLACCAWTEAGEVMALRHRELPLLGLQFHPDSFLTPQGQELFRHALAGLL